MDAVVKLHWLDYLIILVYVGFMLYIGFYFSRKRKGFEDYFIAGRGLTAPLLVGTLVSTFYGLDTLFGTWSEDWEVYVIRFGNVELWQEYGILIITPIALIIYLIVNAVAKKTGREAGVLPPTATADGVTREKSIHRRSRRSSYRALRRTLSG